MTSRSRLKLLGPYCLGRRESVKGSWVSVFVLTVTESLQVTQVDLALQSSCFGFPSGLHMQTTATTAGFFNRELQDKTNGVQEVKLKTMCSQDENEKKTTGSVLVMNEGHNCTKKNK